MSGPRKRRERVEITRSTNDARGLLQKFLEIAVLAGLYETEVPIWQRQRRIARHRPEDRERRQCRVRCLREHGAVARAPHAIEDDADDVNVRAVADEAL